MHLATSFGTAIALALASQATAAAVFPQPFEKLNRPEDFVLKYDNPVTPLPDQLPARLIEASNDPFLATKYRNLLGVIEPCGVIAAHTHPRGTEIDFVAEGQLQIEMFLETGETVVARADAKEGVVIPEGTVHVTSNPGCTRTTAFVNFDHPRAGTIFVGQAISQLPENYLEEAFIGPFPEPLPNIFARQECLERCGLVDDRTGGYGG